ncbi:MAG: hypothetical protein PWP08_1299 [Methanofollis sp.]|nr:hypothetical protein [Methanofollis sp.]
MTDCTRHPENAASGTCMICHGAYCPGYTGSGPGICQGCAYKTLIILIIVVSYTARFGIF